MPNDNDGLPANNEAETHQRDTESNSAIALPASANPGDQNGASSDGRAKKPSRDWFDIANLSVLVFAFLAAAAAAYEADRLANLTEQTLSETHQANVAAERATVFALDAVLETPLSKDQPVKLSIPYGNSGREPAQTMIIGTSKLYTKEDWGDGMSSKAALDIITRQQSCMAIKYDDPGTAMQMVPPTGGRGVFTAHADSSAGGIGSDQSPFNATEALMSGEEIMVQQSCFAYRTLKETHHTSVCFFLRPKFTDPVHLSFCFVGQAAD